MCVYVLYIYKDIYTCIYTASSVQARRKSTRQRFLTQRLLKKIMNNNSQPHLPYTDCEVWLSISLKSKRLNTGNLQLSQTTGEI